MLDDAALRTLNQGPGMADEENPQAFLPLRMLAQVDSRDRAASPGFSHPSLDLTVSCLKLGQVEEAHGNPLKGQGCAVRKASMNAAYRTTADASIPTRFRRGAPSFAVCTTAQSSSMPTGGFNVTAQSGLPLTTDGVSHS